MPVNTPAAVDPDSHGEGPIVSIAARAAERGRVPRRCRRVKSPAEEQDFLASAPTSNSWNEDPSSRAAPWTAETRSWSATASISGPPSASMWSVPEASTNAMVTGRCSGSGYRKQGARGARSARSREGRRRRRSRRRSPLRCVGAPRSARPRRRARRGTADRRRPRSPGSGAPRRRGGRLLKDSPEVACPTTSSSRSISPTKRSTGPVCTPTLMRSRT